MAAKKRIVSSTSSLVNKMEAGNFAKKLAKIVVMGEERKWDRKKKKAKMKGKGEQTKNKKRKE